MGHGAWAWRCSVWTWRCALASLLALSPVQVGAVQLSGHKGVGYAQAIGGPDGLAISVGAGNLIIEGILGFQYASFDDPTRGAETRFDLGLGAHFQVLRAQWASLTLGARFTLLTGPDLAGSGADVLQWGVDLPVRVYWFPLPNLSVHTELGVSIQPGPQEGVLTEGLTPQGLRINAFNGPTRFGGLGLTFWWS